MDDGAPNSMNLDLNLGPNDDSSNDTEPESGFFTHDPLEDWLPVNRLRETVRQRRRQRWRPVWRQFQVSPESRTLALGLDDGIGLHVGEGSIAAEERPSEGTKTCDGIDGFLDDEVLGKKDNEEKGNDDVGCFFDCNVCLDLADDPVVTCCGHLFCWPCLYRWLHLHSDAKECPVCKGEVSLKNVTPIYGRGKNLRQSVGEINNLKVPHRPQARRVESWRQAIQRSGFNVPMEEMIRRLGNRFDLSQQVHPHHTDSPQELHDRSNSLLNQILTSRGLRREQNSSIPPEEDVFDDSTPRNPEATYSRPSPSAYLRRTNSNLASTFSDLESSLASAERLVESFLQDAAMENNQEPQPRAVGDRDSMSSIAAVIYSDSQTVDTTFETDSTVSLSTSTSRRRQNASRVSDVDSGDSRAPRRRRLN